MKVTTSATNAGPKNTTASCQTGDRLIGGGAETSSNDVYVYRSAPNATPTATSWSAAADENGNVNSSWTLSAWAVCADETP